MLYERIASNRAKKQPIQIVNGKLVIEQDAGLENISHQIAELSEKFEQLNPQTDPTAIIQQNQELYLNQVRGVKKAIDRLESLYRQFFFWAIAFLIVSIMVWLVFLFKMGKCWLIA